MCVCVCIYIYIYINASATYIVHDFTFGRVLFHSSSTKWTVQCVYVIVSVGRAMVGGGSYYHLSLECHGTYVPLPSADLGCLKVLSQTADIVLG